MHTHIAATLCCLRAGNKFERRAQGSRYPPDKRGRPYSLPACILQRNSHVFNSKCALRPFTPTSGPRILEGVGHAHWNYQLYLNDSFEETVKNRMSKRGMPYFWHAKIQLLQYGWECSLKKSRIKSLSCQLATLRHRMIVFHYQNTLNSYLVYLHPHPPAIWSTIPFSWSATSRTTHSAQLRCPSLLARASLQNENHMLRRQPKPTDRQTATITSGSLSQGLPSGYFVWDLHSIKLASPYDNRKQG